MGILDIISGKKAKKQIVIARKCFDILESEFLHDQEVLLEYYSSAQKTIVTDKAEYNKFTKNGRNFFRNIGYVHGCEPLFNDIAAGSMFFSPIDQAMLSLMIFHLYTDKEEEEQEFLIKKIESTINNDR